MQSFEHYFTWDLLHGDSGISLPGDTAQLSNILQKRMRSLKKNSTCWKITNRSAFSEIF